MESHNLQGSFIINEHRFLFFVGENTYVYTLSNLYMPDKHHSEKHTSGEFSIHLHRPIRLILIQSWLSSLSNSSSEQSVSYISTSWYSSKRVTGFDGWIDPRCFLMNFISWATMFLSVSLSPALNSETRGKMCSMAAWTLATLGATRPKCVRYIYTT